MALLEPWRSRYLEALGIEQWMVRAPLPNAAPSVEPAWGAEALADDAFSAAPERHEADVGVDHVAAFEPRPPEQPAVAARSEARVPVVDDRRVAKAPAEPAEVEPKPAKPRLAVRFSLLMVRPSSDLLIIDAAEGRFEIGDYLRLATQVARAIGADAASASHDFFRWPIAHHPRLATDEAAATEALTGCLLQQLQGEGQRLLVLGEVAQRWVTEEVVSAAGSCKSVKGPSLWHCMATAEAKRSLWEALVSAQFAALH